MRTAIPLVVIIVMIAISSQAAIAGVKRHASIPQALQGSWATSADACKIADKSAVALAAKTYAGPAGNCAVMSVSETPSPHGAVYSARLRCPIKNGQQKWSETNLVIRPDDTNQISAGPDFGSLKTYQRCP
ncbi:MULTISPECIES: hypothetical protein [unclassified Bradyrhizobium]|uniref:hypothetical protein n=1 Tax=unclassified Bradyrhizobium TaxID=2631580 RepID=UPI00247A3923|nr:MULTISPECIES: hypothetical protein [unclassified Bradyrhizobium]WGR69050.1 hypothetical protein MTX24_26950 [Bradyrhizobium sp. ISRA426]WGR81105.1 hypothetical protein MTX21_12065 [Bradyrhizobium sp. ISRA430]WGR84289.1 hypothetical protein MTX25_26630 [Bradyrhizobium sp. ISRA432]